MLIGAYSDNTKCRTHYKTKKMEEDEGLRTVECLRGRLQAERQASRTAKEEAELMSKKIAELEAHLMEEIKLREKAERRLRFLMKKLISLKGSHNIKGSERSSSSAISCVSSTDTYISKEEDQETKTRITNPDETGDRDVGEVIKPDRVTANGHSVEENSSVKLGKLSFASTTSHEEQNTEHFTPSSPNCRQNTWKTRFRTQENENRGFTNDERFILNLSNKKKKNLKREDMHITKHTKRGKKTMKMKIKMGIHGRWYTWRHIPFAQKVQ